MRIDVTLDEWVVLQTALERCRRAVEENVRLDRETMERLGVLPSPDGMLRHEELRLELMAALRGKLDRAMEGEQAR